MRSAPPLRPPRAAATAATVLLAICAVIGLLKAAVWLGLAVVASDGLAPSLPFWLVVVLDGPLSLRLLLVSSAGPVLVWLYQARAFVDLVSPGGQRWGRPWVFFAWVVPIAWLWIPMQLVGDVLRSSAPAPVAPPAVGDPSRGRPRMTLSDGLVLGWWAAFVLGMSRSVFALVTGGGPARLGTYAVSTALWSAAAGLLILIIRRTTRFQGQIVAAGGDRS